MVDIRPNALPAAILPLRNGDAVIVDQGADGVRQTNPVSFTDSVAPVATQAEAQTGADNTKRMTPLRTKQSIASEVGVTLASNAQGAKADSAVQSVNGKTGNSVTLVKGDVGLGNVDNTSDANKPISTATQAALDGKASSAQGAKADSAVQSVNGKTGNTITITKTDVGLGNVDNTSDANKPISTATQTALNAKANSSVTISAGTGLTGGGNLTANRTVSLNSASIASLAKADSAVQTVNGVSPTGGNVTVAAEEKRLQDTRTTAIAESFPSNVQFVETAGYSSVGDGGGALYKRVSSEPSHAGKFQSADGAWWELDMKRGVNVLQFGAKGDGVTDDSASIQNAVDALGTIGGIVSLPRGVFNLVTPISITQQTVSWQDTKRISFIGAGSGLTTLRYVGAAAVPEVLVWTTNNMPDTDGTYGNSWAKIGGFFVNGNALANNCITVVAKSWFEMDDIKALGAVERNFHFISTVSWSGRSLRSYGSKIGMLFELGSSGAPAASYSIPNNITLIDCTIGNSTVWGVHARNSGPINFIGGSFEGNGTHGTDASGGIYLITNDAGIGIEASAANFYGTYFEHNAGGADIYFSQQSGTFPRSINIFGANFNRVSSTKYTTNNVRVEVLGASYAKANLQGCGFNYGGDYVPNAARRCLAMTGNVANVGNSINFDTATVFRSTVDGPSDLNGPWNSSDALAFATLRCGADGSIVRKRNVMSVQKIETGKYKINFNYRATSGSPQVVGSIVGGHGTVNVVDETASYVTVEIKNITGATVDQAFSVIIFDA